MANESLVKPPSEMESSRISEREPVVSRAAGVVDLLLILAERKRLLACFSFVGGIVAAVGALLMPNVYTATALIMPPQQGQSTATALLAQLGPLANSAGRELGLKSPADLYLGLLASRTIADNLINRFSLQTAYGAKTLTDARNILHRRRTFSAGKDSLIRIDVEDTDPKRAAALANAYVDELHKQNSRFATSEASQRRLFLTVRVAEEKKALSSAEDAMRRMQVRTGVIQVDAQAQVVIASIAQLRAEIAFREVALERLQMGATPENPEVVRVKTELGALRLQLGGLQNSPSSGAGNPMLSTSTIPQAGLDYLRCLRDLKYHEFLFEMLAKQYEAAKIDEAKQAPVLQVVDHALPPERKSGPPRTAIVILGIMISALLSSIIAYVQSALSDPGRLAHLARLRSLLLS